MGRYWEECTEVRVMCETELCSVPLLRNPGTCQKTDGYNNQLSLWFSILLD